MRTDHAGGGTLADRLQSGPLSRAELEQLAEDLLGMLASLHAKGTPHRDLSPASVRLDSAGRLHSSKIGSQRGSVAGGPADVAADLYACGTVLAAAAGPDASAPVMVLIGMLTADADLRPASAVEALALLGAPSAHLPGPAPAPQLETPPPVETPVPPSPAVAPPDVPTEAVPFPPLASFPPAADSRPVADTPLVGPPVVHPPPRRPTRRGVLAGVGAIIAALAVVGGVLALGTGDDAGTEIPPPAQAPLHQQLDALDGVIDTLGR